MEQQQQPRTTRFLRELKSVRGAGIVTFLLGVLVIGTLAALR